MKALYGAENPSSASDVIEGRLIAIALRTLRLGINVALDFGLWSRDERSALRYAGDQVEASVVMWYARSAWKSSDDVTTFVSPRNLVRPGLCPTKKW